jgi:protein pelota
MIIINSDFRKGTVKLRIDSPEDIWYISHLIDPKDLVKGKTTRKIKIGENENAKTVKKTLTLKVEAEMVEFNSTGDALRINGKVKEAPEEIPKDSYHTITLELGSEFLLEKTHWMEYQKQKLKESAEKKKNQLLCLFDREEVLFALTKNVGYQILAKLTGDVPKKTKTVEVKKDFQTEIVKSLETYTERYNPENVIVASPAFYKEDLFKKIFNPDLKKKVILATCSSISESALDEVMRNPKLEKTLKSSRTRKEAAIVDELLNAISKDNSVAYGELEVKKAAEAGAISKLIISDKFIKQKKEDQTFEEVDSLMKTVDSLKAEIHIISSKSESGKKLDGLSGIAALLRYNLQ